MPKDFILADAKVKPAASSGGAWPQPESEAERVAGHCHASDVRVSVVLIQSAGSGINWPEGLLVNVPAAMTSAATCT